MAVSGFGFKSALSGGKCFSGLLLCCCAFCAQGQWLYLSPWAGFASGNLGLSYDRSQGNQSGGLVGEVKARINSSGFIYRPWILTSRLRAETNIQHNLYNIIDQEQQTLADTTVGGSFQLYPDSEYSTEIDLEQQLGIRVGDKTNSRHRTMIKLANDYQPDGADYSLINNLRWTNEQQEQNNRTFSSLTLDSRFQQASDDDGGYNIILSADSRIAKSDLTGINSISISPDQIKQELDERNNVGISYNQQWQHSDLGSSSLFASYQIEEFKQNLVKQTFKRGQLSSLNFLQSENDRRLSYSLSLLANDTTIETATAASSAILDPASQSKNQNLNTSAGFNFEYSEILKFQGSANVNHQITSQQKRTNYQQSIAAQYSDRTELTPKVLYGWNARLRLSGIQSSGEMVNRGELSLTPNLGHNINTDFVLFDETIRLNASQELGHFISDRQSDSLSQWTLSQNGSVQWSSNNNAGQSDVFISLDVVRHLNDLPMQQQSLYINFQRSTQLNEDTDWGGGLTYEWRKQVDEQFLEQINRTAGGSLWYRDNELFGIPNLVLQSTLELPINDLLFDNKERGNDRTNWQNRLDFRMGLLEARAQMDLTPDNYHFSISIRRHFGMPL